MSGGVDSVMTSVANGLLTACEKLATTNQIKLVKSGKYLRV